MTEEPNDLTPQIELPQEAVPLPLIIGLALLLGLGLFLYLDSNRRAMMGDIDGARAGNQTSGPPAPVPDLIIPPPEPPTAPPVVPDPGRATPAALATTAQPMMPRLGPANVSVGKGADPAVTVMFRRPRGNEPALVADLTAGSGAPVNGSNPAAAETGDDAVRATIIRNRGSIIPQGAIIAATLETPLDSDRPGLARAITSQDVRSFDGTKVLIPRGSRLIGEFKAETGAGLRRVLVTWNRLIRPDGVAIRIGSPVTDAMGGAGVPGRVNTHFLERFGNAVLQSALTVGVNLASLPRDSAGVYVGLPATAAEVSRSIAPSNPRSPTVKVREGAQVAVLVARDLDFSGTSPVR